MKNEDKKLFGRIIVVSAILIFSGLVLVIFFCDYSESGICSEADFEIAFGVVIGVITTASFFVFIERHQNQLASKINEVLAGTYAVRTDMFNLLDVFKGKAHKIQPNEENRKIFVDQLEDHIKGFGLEDHPKVSPIWKEAKNHEKQIPETVHDKKNCKICQKIEEEQKKHWNEVFSHQPNCTKCKEIGNLIENYLDEFKNPLQVDK